MVGLDGFAGMIKNSGKVAKIFPDSHVNLKDGARIFRRHIGKKVSVDIQPPYVCNGTRPASFVLEYKVDNVHYKVIFNNED